MVLVQRHVMRNVMQIGDPHPGILKECACIEAIGGRLRHKVVPEVGSFLFKGETPLMELLNGPSDSLRGLPWTTQDHFRRGRNFCL